MPIFTAFLRQMYKANIYTYIKGRNVIIFYSVWKMKAHINSM